MFHVTKSTIKEMRALQREVVQDNFVEKGEKGLEEVEIGNQHEEEDTRKQKHKQNKTKCYMKQLIEREESRNVDLIWINVIEMLI